MSEVELVSREKTPIDELKRKLVEIGKNREGKWSMYGKDGTLVSERTVYKYRGIPFEIIKMEYFSFNEPNPLDATLSSGKGHYYLLEYVKEEPWIKLHKLIDEFFDRTWLWEDTCHYFMDDWSDTQQINWLIDKAKEDIDWLIDKARDELERVKKEIDLIVSECES